MAQSAEAYLSAWESSAPKRARYNGRIVAGACVMETLTMVYAPELRYVFVDDFGYAITYCRQRLREDLTPPDQRGSDEPLEQWNRLRAAIPPDDLANAWLAADVAFTALLADFIAKGYRRSQGDRLREIVNIYGFDLELGEIYVLPLDVRALLARVGQPFTSWDAGASRAARKQQAFDFSNSRHRAALARRLRAANGPSGANEAGEIYKPYTASDAHNPFGNHTLN